MTSVLLAVAFVTSGCASEVGLDLQAPTGPGTVEETDAGEFVAFVAPGESLDFSVSASTDVRGEIVDVATEPVGGSLTASDAGFATPLPLHTRGPEEQRHLLKGVAAASGTIELLVTARTESESASWTLTIIINTPPVLAPPTGPGEIRGEAGVYEAVLEPGEPLDSTVSATDADGADDLALQVEHVGGTLDPLEAGFATELPATATGQQAVTLDLEGTALAAGTVVLHASVDDGVASDSWLLTIRISTPPNLTPPTAPGAVTGSDGVYATEIAVGESLDVSTTATDPDPGETLTVTAHVTGGFLTASQAGFDGTWPKSITGEAPQTLGLTGTAATGGVLELTVTASDGAHEVSWVLTIEINAPPVLAPPADPGLVSGSDGVYETTLGVGDALDSVVSASDPDPEDTLALSVEVIGGTLSPSAAGFSTSFPATATDSSPVSLWLEGVAAEPGTIVLRAEVDDGRNDDSWELTIRINAAPVLDAPTGPGSVSGGPSHYTTRLAEGDSLDFSVTATDADAGDTLDLSVEVVGGTLDASEAGFTTSLPASTAGSSPQTLSLSGTAAAGGTIWLRAWVSDGFEWTDWLLEIRINHPPELSAPIGLANMSGSGGAYSATVQLGESLDFAAVATDADTADALSVTATVTGGTLTASQAGFNESFPHEEDGTSPVVIECTGTAANWGTIELRVEVDDGLATDAWTLELYINAPPELGVPTGPGTISGTAPSYETTVEDGEPLDFQIEATDPDPNDTLTLTVSHTGGMTPADAGFTTSFPATDVDTSPVSLSFDGTASTQSGTIELTLHVEDSHGASDTATLTITIDGWVAPEFTNAPSTIAQVGELWSYTPSASGKPTPTISVGSLPSWLSWDGTTLSGTPSMSDGPETPTITITASSAQPPDAVMNFTILIGEWTREATGFHFTGITGSGPNDIHIVDRHGAVLHYDGSSFSETFTGVRHEDVWVDSASYALAVGAEGEALEFDGTDWSAIATGSTAPLHTVWGADASLAHIGSEPQDTIHTYDGSNWDEESTPASGTAIRGIWGSSANNAYAVGTGGTILHYDGTDWIGIGIGGGYDYHAVWGSGANDIFVVGSQGVVRHFNGTGWSTAYLPPSNVHGIWGSSGSDVFAVGDEGSIFHYNGSTWSTVHTGNDDPLHDVWGTSSTNVYAVGANDTVLHYDGNAWTALRSNPMPRDVRAVDGLASNDLFLVVPDGIYHDDGSGWTAMPPGTSEELFDVWVYSANSAFVSGTGRTLLEYDGTQWSPLPIAWNWHEYETVWGVSPTEIYVYSDGTIERWTGSFFANESAGPFPRGLGGTLTGEALVFSFHGDISVRNGSSWQTFSPASSVVLHDVWGASPNDVFGVGEGGVIYHLDGTSMQQMDSATASRLRAIDGRSASDAIAVGDSGVIRHYNGEIWSEIVPPDPTLQTLVEVWVEPNGHDIVILGEDGLILRFSN